MEKEAALIGGQVKKVRLAKYNNILDENGNPVLDENGNELKETEPFEVWEGTNQRNMQRIK